MFRLSVYHISTCICMVDPHVSPTTSSCGLKPVTEFTSVSLLFLVSVHMMLQVYFRLEPNLTVRPWANKISTSVVSADVRLQLRLPH
jgi:hypothetical protein